jgi:hypothetical protein
MHWNGTDWTITPTANPSFGANQLKKVIAFSSDDVWSVGGHGEPYTLRWNGSAWTQVPLPAIAAGDATAARSYLEDIAAVSKEDIWMVGSVQAADGSSRTLTMHWNGSSWTQVPSPNVTTTRGGVYPQGLESVVAVGPNDVWAAGSYRIGDTVHTLVLRWNGQQWSIVPTPNGPAGNGWLHGIAASGPNDVWAVGEHQAAAGTSGGTAFAMHWNGSAWTVAVPPNPSPTGVNPLQSIVARGPNDFYAVGAYETATEGMNTFVVRWNGTEWTQMPSETPAGNGTGWNPLFDVSRAPGGELWAVGKKQAALGDPSYTLVQRAFVPGAVTVNSAVSRKTHGGAGEFDMPLAQGGTPTVESRSSNGNHTIVFKFASRLASVGSASVTRGSAQVSSSGLDPADDSRYIVNLANVPDAQRVTISLADVADIDGNQSATVPITLDVLAGDANGDTSVNIGDTLQTRSRVGQLT